MSISSLAAMPSVKDTGDYWEFYITGSTDKRKEQMHQIDSWAYLSYHYPDAPAFHPVNEGLIPVQYRTKLVQEGLVSGVSDVVILLPKGEYPYACIELKRATKTLASPVSDEQGGWLRKCRAVGGFSAVCYGFESFKLAISYYMSL